MISVRRFQNEDENTVIELIKAIMNQEFRGDQAAYPTEDIQNIHKAYSGLGEAFFVATDGTKIVGTVAIKKEDGRIALLRRLFVANDYRGRQIGVKLIDEALEFCDKVGYDEIVFRATSQMVGAIKLCQKKGFVQRAKLQLGPVELLKLTRHVPHAVKSSGHSH